MITYELATDIIYPNINVYRGFTDGVLKRYKVEPAEGYVFYDTAEENFEQDSLDSEPRPVTYYYTLAFLPTNYNFDNFHYVAVLRSEEEQTRMEAELQ